MWEKIKGLIVEEDGAPKPVAQKPTVVASSGLPQSPAPVNDQFVTALRSTLKNRATAFTSLLSGAEKLAAYIPDQTMRFKAAFDQIKGEGRGVRDIAAAIEVHSSDLAAQQLQFDQAVDRETTATIGAMQNEFDRLKPANDTIQTQIQQLNEQVARLQTQMTANVTRSSELQAQIAAETARFATRKQEFETAMAVVKSELDGQKNIILTALS